MPFYIVITQYDMDALGIANKPPEGPLVHESRLLTEEEATSRARSLGGRYGWAVVAMVDVDGLKPANEKQPESKDDQVPF